MSKTTAKGTGTFAVVPFVSICNILAVRSEPAVTD